MLRQGGAAIRVSEVRNRVVEKVADAAASGDEESAAEVLDFCRAMLIALASHAPESDVDVQKLEIKTGTAGRILGFNQEYVRERIRRGVLPATKKNGEYYISLAEVVQYRVKSVKFSSGPMPPDAAKWLEFKPGPMAGWPKKPHRGHGPKPETQ